MNQNTKSSLADAGKGLLLGLMTFLLGVLLAMALSSPKAVMEVWSR